MSDGAPAPAAVFGLPGFRPYWVAGTVSDFGSFVTALALQVLVVQSLHGSAFEVGLLKAATWLPYVLLGLVVGAMVERRRWIPILIGSDLARAVILLAIPALWLLGWLSLPAVLIFVGVFGVFTLLNDSAAQSLLPRLVPAASLLHANARIDQSYTLAETAGPVIAGALVSVIGAPFAVLVDAASYLFSAAALTRVRLAEPRVRGWVRTQVARDIRDGLRWVYGHRTLAPMAVSTHVWFLFSSILTTVFVPFLLIGLGMSAFQLGIALAAAGVGGVAGALLATRIGLRWGVGWTVVAGTALMAVAWTLIAFVPGDSGTGWQWGSLVLIAVGQALFGFALGAENANEMGYRQAVTPDALQGRMNATMRTINRAALVVGALVGGLLANEIGFLPTILIGVAGLVVSLVIMVASPFRTARHGEVAPEFANTVGPPDAGAP
ncbi:MAG: MFS transporter [Acetobacteraceae bacterium]